MDAPLTDRASLIEWIEKGCKPRSQWLVGLEHEEFGFLRKTLTPLPYEGAHGICALMEKLATQGWARVEEEGRLVALKRPKNLGGGDFTLEPGGQLELAAAPLRTVEEVHHHVSEHVSILRATLREWDIDLLQIGFAPTWSIDDMPLPPKPRYVHLRHYLDTRGPEGAQMMYRTCASQVNLDYKDEADMVLKMRVGLALQPIAIALLANSPFAEGRDSGVLSYRSHLWAGTDHSRTGLLPFVFEDGFGFERYVDYALTVPLCCVMRDGRCIGAPTYPPFRDFFEGKLEGGERPTPEDWEIHLTTIWPEARLKHFIEMRGADMGPINHLSAHAAFWVGLLYDSDCLHAAWDVAKDWSAEERWELRLKSCQTALHAPFRKETIGDIAERVLEIAQVGLKRWNPQDAPYLHPLLEIAQTRTTRAEKLLQLYNSAWKQDVTKIFECFDV